MYFQEIKPSAELAPYIKHYWTMKSCITPSSSYFQRIAPNGFADITFYFGKAPVYLRKKQSIASNILINGQHDSYYDIKLTDKTELISVVFTPYGANAFFNLPLHELYDQSISAEFVFGAAYQELKNKLEHTRNFSERIQHIENFMLKKLSSKKEYELKRMFHCIKLITQKRGLTSVSHLAEETCLSEKQFNRSFQELIGIAPKKYLRVIRFQHAIYNQQTNPSQSLTTLAHNSGYFDQSHMINDFNSLSGLTPKQYFAECEPYSDYFSIK